MLRLTDPEEPPTEELDPDYTDDLGDDMPGATPHPFIDPITHCKYLELLELYFQAILLLIGCMLVTTFEPFTLLQPYSYSPCC
jgi:hypothetical protein